MNIPYLAEAFFTISLLVFIFTFLLLLPTLLKEKSWVFKKSQIIEKRITMAFQNIKTQSENLKSKVLKKNPKEWGFIAEGGLSKVKL